MILEEIFRKSVDKFGKFNNSSYLCIAFEKKYFYKGVLERWQSGRLRSFGEVAEWSIAAVLKTVVLRGTRGSNPCLSADKCWKISK